MVCSVLGLPGTVFFAVLRQFGAVLSSVSCHSITVLYDAFLRFEQCFLCVCVCVFFVCVCGGWRLVIVVRLERFPAVAIISV